MLVREIRVDLLRWWLLVLFTSSIVNAQDNIGIKLFGLSIHPKGEKENRDLMPRKLDPNGYLVINLGAMASYEKFVHKDIFSIKIVQSLYSDCAAQLGGFSHIGFRGKIFKTNKHALYGGIGPTLVFRRNWLRLDGYVNRNRFKGNSDDKWQYMFLWYGGEFEYAYRLSEHVHFTTTFIPGYPDLMSLSFGMKYELN
ncbi:MAG TPA: hypothetical protein VIK89_03995 [Cytophagaceae bacterium]